MSDALSALLHLSAHDYSWLAQFFSLLFLPFAHEDLAIILGAYIVVNKIMPVGLVVLCIYGGMVASDFALYGIGAGARRLPWLTRLAVDDRVGLWAWPFLLCVLVAIGFLRRQVFGFQQGFTGQEPSDAAGTDGHRGMSALAGPARKV